MNFATDNLLPIAVIAIMFALGLTLRLEELRRTLRSPRILFAVLFNQSVILPILGFAAGHLFRLESALGLGVVLIASAPGGSASSLFTHLAKGDVMLATVLTAVSSFTCLATIPVAIGLAHGLTFQELGFDFLALAKIALALFATVTLPVLAGIGLSRWQPVLTSRMSGTGVGASIAFFVFAIIWAIFLSWDHIPEYLGRSAPCVLLLNLLALISGLAVSGGCSIKGDRRIAVILQTGMRNSPLAIFTAIVVFGVPEMAFPAAAYGIVQLATAGIAALAWRTNALRVVK
jgi:BASS family bile acid:Na+ symporter